MMSITKILKKIALIIEIRCQQIEFDGRENIAAFVTDHETSARMLVAQANTDREIKRLEAEYRKLCRGTGTQPMRRAAA